MKRLCSLVFSALLCASLCLLPAFSFAETPVQMGPSLQILAGDRYLIEQSESDEDSVSFSFLDYEQGCIFQVNCITMSEDMDLNGTMLRIFATVWGLEYDNEIRQAGSFEWLWCGLVDEDEERYDVALAYSGNTVLQIILLYYPSADPEVVFQDLLNNIMPAQPSHTENASVEEIIGKWKMTSISMAGLETSMEDFSTQMMLEFKADNRVTVFQNSLSGEYKEESDTWRYDAATDTISIPGGLDFQVEQNSGEIRLKLSGSLLGLSGTTIYFTRVDDDASIKPDASSADGKNALTAMPNIVKAITESSFFGDWKLTYIDYSYSLRPTSIEREYIISQGMAKEITEYGTETYQTVFQDGILYLLVPNNDGTNTRIACFLLTDGNIAQDFSYIASMVGNNERVMGYFEKVSFQAPQPEVGSYVTFGHYPQTASGTDNTPIEWLVLDVQGDKALLISRYGLDAVPYNNENVDITWEKCTLRTWLNKDFYGKAFTAQEQSAILTTTVDNSQSQCYSGWSTNSGDNTQDKIFLLSYAEANKYFGVEDWKVTGSDENTNSRVAPTAYAIAQGAFSYSDCKTADGAAAGWWWLRSPGSNQNDVALVFIDGSLFNFSVDIDNAVVRPALWINLESGIF